ncbi:MAG: hypothetical protein ABIH23_08310 [bacterium]
MSKAQKKRHISILNVRMICESCGWEGSVYQCEPDCDGDGSLGCPNCGEIVGEKKGR